MATKHDLEDLNKRCERSITKMSDAQALAHIGKLIDEAFDASFDRGAKRSLYLLDELSKRKLADADGALVEYFRANAWAARSAIANVRQSWSWEASELQEELLALSRASNHAGFARLDKVRRCQILTNHANLLNTVGRSIDAITVWDAALAIVPGFAMARGNRGYGLKGYAGMLVDNRERAIVALHAHQALRSSMFEDAFHDSVDPRGALAFFADQAAELAGAVNINVVSAMQNLDHGDEGRSKLERAYRRWCREHRLYLSPLNDLGPHLAAATDSLMLPGPTEGLNDRADGHLPPPIVGFFSQMKQEYASARFMLFEGMSSTRTHFSDRNVALTDTLDYTMAFFVLGFDGALGEIIDAKRDEQGLLLDVERMPKRVRVRKVPSPL
jgi:hypothetical protein